MLIHFWLYVLFCFFPLCWHLVLPKKCNTHFKIMCLSIIAILKTVLSHWWFTGQYLHLFTGNDVKSILLSIISRSISRIVVVLKGHNEWHSVNQILKVFKKRIERFSFYMVCIKIIERNYAANMVLIHVSIKQLRSRRQCYTVKCCKLG